MKQILLILMAVALVGCGKKTPKEPQTEQRSVTLAEFLKGKRIHFEMDNGAGPFWAEFAADGTHRHSDRPAGTYEVHGQKVAVQDSEKVELIFLSSEISAGDTFEAKALGAKKGLHFKVLKVDKMPVLTTKEVAETNPETTKVVPEELIADPIVEKEIRYEIKKPTGNLVKADYEKVIKLFLSGKKLTEVPKGLEKLPNLMYLWLPHNKLTDVKGLEKLPQLSILYLHGNPVLTKAQIAELQKALPNCTIHSNPTK